MNRFCHQCGKDLPKQSKIFCSVRCNGLSKRGKGKNHIRILVNGKRVYLHRYLVEKHVRPLAEGEIVHHKDGDKFNNSLENLEILSGQSAHLHCHDYFRGKHRNGKSEAQLVAEYLEERGDFPF